MKPRVRRCCGIDVHKKSVTVCVLPPLGRPEVAIRKRAFRTYTRELKKLRTWLKNCLVTEIAMESTGQYWRSGWYVLGDQFSNLLLRNASDIYGRQLSKTDA